MKSIILDDVTAYIKKDIGVFHKNRLAIALLREKRLTIAIITKLIITPAMIPERTAKKTFQKVIIASPC